MDLYKWSKTAANNNSAAPDGFPEGMAPSGVNNASREVMAAVKRGAIIWWDSVASMRAPTADPEEGTRHALLDKDNLGTKARLYEWNASYTPGGAVPGHNGTTVIIPDSGSFTGGAFVEVGPYEPFVELNDANLILGELSLTGVSHVQVSLTTTTTIVSAVGMQEGQHAWIIARTNAVHFGFSKPGTNMKCNMGQDWKGQAFDFFYGRFDGSALFLIGEKSSPEVPSWDLSGDVSNLVVEIQSYNNRAEVTLVGTLSATTTFTGSFSTTTTASGTSTHTGSGSGTVTTTPTTYVVSTINGGGLGCVLTVFCDSQADVKLEDGTGNLALAGDFSMDPGDSMLLARSSAGGWVEVSRSDNTP